MHKLIAVTATALVILPGISFVYAQVDIQQSQSSNVNGHTTVMSTTITRTGLPHPFVTVTVSNHINFLRVGKDDIRMCFVWSDIGGHPHKIVALTTC